MADKNEHNSNNLRGKSSKDIKKKSIRVPRLIVVILMFVLIVFLFSIFFFPQLSQTHESKSELYSERRSELGHITASYASMAEAETQTDNKQEELKVIQPIQQYELDSDQPHRLVVYNAIMNVVVERISESINQIKTIVTNMGGYMQELSSNSITLKIPADKFLDAITEVEKLGEVTRKDIKGLDVTEEMRDLTIRLRNAEQVRERLLKLLDRAEKVEDALKIEKELERVTETIELLKGKISYLQNKVALSTLIVYFNSPIPQKDIIIGTPFRWVHTLGSEMAKPVTKQTCKNSFFSRKMFTLPDGYIKYQENKKYTRAISANDVMIHMHKQKNYKGGTVDFWSSLVKRVLVEQKVIHINKVLERNLGNNNKVVISSGSKKIGSKQYGYLVALATTKRNVYIFEAWGPFEKFNKDFIKLSKAVDTMQLI